jgi:hypothetical protein
VTESDRTKGVDDSAQPPLLQTERDGKQPAHRRIQPMESAQGE